MWSLTVSIFTCSMLNPAYPFDAYGLWTFAREKRKWLQRGLVKIEAVQHVIGFCIAFRQRFQVKDRFGKAQQADMRVKCV